MTGNNALFRYGRTFATAILVVMVVAGCGSGTTRRAPTRSAVTVSFHWPRATTGTRAALPSAANSVVVGVTDQQGFSDSRTLNRPSSEADGGVVTAEFFALAEGRATITAVAFAGADGAGERVGEGATTAELKRGREVRTTVNIGPIYTRIVVSPTTAEVLQGQVVTLVAQGQTDGGVVTQPQPVGQWSSSNTAVAAVSPGGVVTGLQPGTATITFRDTAGREGAAVVTVRGGDAEVIIQ